MIKRAYIEIINTCNLNCGFCMKNHRHPSSLDTSTFRYILEQVKDYTDYIYLHVQGEPLMHPQFEEIMNICDAENVHVHIVTNGTYLKDHLDMGKHPSLRKVSISLQSVEYQNQISISDYMNSVIAFCEKSSSMKRPYTELRFWRNDERNMPHTKFCLQALKNRYDFVETDRLKNYMILPNVYVDFDNEFEWPTMNNPAITDKGRCLGAVEQIAILSNGNVVPCCLDCEGSVCFGNIRITSLREILNSGRYLKMVHAFQNNQIREPLCQKCSFRKRFDK